MGKLRVRPELGPKLEKTMVAQTFEHLEDRRRDRRTEFELVECPVG